jgi:hypothetical protein
MGVARRSAGRPQSRFARASGARWRVEATRTFEAACSVVLVGGNWPIASAEIDPSADFGTGLIVRMFLGWPRCITLGLKLIASSLDYRVADSNERFVGAQLKPVLLARCSERLNFSS